MGPGRFAISIRRLRRPLVAAAALTAAALLLPSAAAGKGGSTDFGDAPDGGNLGLGKKGKKGAFPSKAATPGPRHTSIGSFFLGRSVDGESDSHQVNRDLFDDGAEATLSPCGASTLEVALNGTALPAATKTSAHTAYVNAWFDWNGDGDWSDSSDACRPEWAIQNLPVDMSALAAEGMALLPISFTAGTRTRDIWYRVTLTLDQPVTDSTSKGPPAPYVQGETEDYYIGTARPPVFDDGGGGGGKKKKGKFKVSCVPNPALILHGGTAKVRFAIQDTGKGHIFGTVLGKPGAKDGKMKLIPKKPQPKGVPPGWTAMDGFSFKSSKVDPPLRIQKVTITFGFARGGQSQKLKCAINILHLSIKLPPFKCVGGCGGMVVQPPHVGSELSSGWNEVPTELVQLQLQSVQPVTEVRLPLHGQTPPWPSAALMMTNDPNLTGAVLGTITPEGGPAALVLMRQPVPINPPRAYLINPGTAINPGVPVVGRATISGQLFSFAAPG